MLPKFATVRLLRGFVEQSDHTVARSIEAVRGFLKAKEPSTIASHIGWHL